MPTWMFELRHIIDLIVNQQPKIPLLIMLSDLLKLSELLWLHILTDEIILHLLLGLSRMSSVLEYLGTVLASPLSDEIGTTRVTLVEG